MTRISFWKNLKSEPRDNILERVMDWELGDSHLCPGSSSDSKWPQCLSKAICKESVKWPLHPYQVDGILICIKTIIFQDRFWIIANSFMWLTTFYMIEFGWFFLYSYNVTDYLCLKRQFLNHWKILKFEYFSILSTVPTNILQLD